MGPRRVRKLHLKHEKPGGHRRSFHLSGSAKTSKLLLLEDWLHIRQQRRSFLVSRWILSQSNLGPAWSGNEGAARGTRMFPRTSLTVLEATQLHLSRHELTVLGDKVMAAWARAAMQSHSATVCLRTGASAPISLVATGGQHAGPSQARGGLPSASRLDD